MLLDLMRGCILYLPKVYWEICCLLYLLETGLDVAFKTPSPVGQGNCLLVVGLAMAWAVWYMGCISAFEVPRDEQDACASIASIA